MGAGWVADDVGFIVYKVFKMTEHPVSVRVDEDTIERLDRIAEAMSKRAAGVNVKRGTVVRAAIERGIVALEAELGLKKPKR